MPLSRERADRCPGVTRPWPAADGLLVRIRLVGGALPVHALVALVGIAVEYGDRRVYVTGRANLQLRGLPDVDGRLDPRVVDAIAASGLLPSRTHDLVRNVMVSPQTGLAGGRVDLRPVAASLDERLCTDPKFAALPGRFLFVLDDGHGDLLDRPCDLGLVALSGETVQLRIGSGWGAVVSVADAPAALIGLATAFLDGRGVGPTAAWHVAELAQSLRDPVTPHPDLPEPVDELPWGDVPGGKHVRVTDDGLERSDVESLSAGAETLVITPWRGVLVPDRTRS